MSSAPRPTSLRFADVPGALGIMGFVVVVVVDLFVDVADVDRGGGETDGRPLAVQSVTSTSGLMGQRNALACGA